MQKRVTFHKHEVVGATQTYDFMKRLGFTQPETEYVVKLVRWHQFRFYKDTAKATIAKWLQTLGRVHWRHLMALRLADRAGNLKNAGKPLWTSELKDLKKKCEEMINKKEVVFPDDLKVSKEDLNLLQIPKKRFKEIFANMTAIVKAKPERNNREYLIEYLKKNYVDRRSSGNRPRNTQAPSEGVSH